MKRAHSVDEHHQTKLGASPWGPRLDDWGNKFDSQPLEEVYASYPLNEDAPEEKSESFHDFWDEVDNDESP